MIIALLLGCTAGTDTGAAGVTGTISPDGADSIGEVRGATAFAWAEGDRLIANISSGEGTTCDDVVRYLTDLTYDPSALIPAGTCNIFIRLDSDYASGQLIEDDPYQAAGTAIGCALGEGEFAMADANSSYTWTGTWWLGHPVDYTYTFTEEEDGYSLDLSMEEYDGSYPLSGQLSGVAASGSVSGVVKAQACPELAGLL